MRPIIAVVLGMLIVAGCGGAAGDPNTPANVTAPVGSSDPRRVDCRIIAATNRDLLQSAKSGEFRLDLFYRLAVAPISKRFREKHKSVHGKAENSSSFDLQ